MSSNEAGWPRVNDSSFPSQNLSIRFLLQGGFLFALFVGIGYTLVEITLRDSNPVGAADDYNKVNNTPVADKVKKLNLFSTWPKEKPQVVFLITGQMYGYLQKCGCSNPQKGGLERRYNFLEWMRKDLGWDVLPVDLGDIASIEKPKVREQALEKYKVAMESLKDMGYRTIGIGIEEFRFPLFEALSRFTLQDGNEFPRVQAANLLNRDRDYPGSRKDPSMIYSSDVYRGKNNVNVGIVGLIGKSIIPEIQKIDNKIEFAERSDLVLKECLKEMESTLKSAPELNVLLYQGSFEDSKVLPKFFPEFQIIVCRSEESEPPAQADKIQDSLIVRVGHKGQNVGVVGVFKQNGKYVFHYERVPIGEEFETPTNQEKEHPILQKYESYAKLVQDRNYLRQFPKANHVMQAKLPNEKVAYVGTETCMKCHALEHNEWSKTKHAHAYDALAKIAKHPSMRNFDGECIVCHTVGFEYKTGFDGTNQTMHLKDVGCENCHGPGNLHASNPMKKEYHSFLSPWKGDGKGSLPDLATIEKLAETKSIQDRAKLITPAQEAYLLRIDTICSKCHDVDNDPHYRFEKYWPKVTHSGLRKK